MIMNCRRLVVFGILACCAGSLALAAGAPGEWPFNALPPDTVVYLEIPAPGDTAQAVDRYAADVIGMPLTNLLLTGLAFVLGTNNVAGVDMARPISAFVTQSPDAPGAPNVVLALPITGKDAFLANLKDPGAGQSRATETEGVYMVDDARAPSGKLCFAFSGGYVAVAEKPEIARSGATYFAAGKPILQRTTPVKGDLLVHLPVERLDRDYRNHIEAGLSGMQSAVMQQMEASPKPGETTQQQQLSALMDAEVSAVLDLLGQVAGVVLGVDIMGSDVGMTKRVSPRAGSAFADFIAKNSGLGDLPYKNAIPPDAPMAVSMRINPESCKAMIDWFMNNVMGDLPGLTAEQQTRWRELFNQFVPLFTGKVMAAYTFPADLSGPLAGMHISEVVGVSDPAKTIRLMDENIEPLIEATNSMSAMPGMRMEVESLPAEGDVRTYQVVVTATGGQKMQDMVKAMYGDGFKVQVNPLPQAILLTTDPELGRQVGARVGQPGAAAIHPLESQLPADKLFAMRMSLPAMVRAVMAMGAKTAAATGDPAATAALPPPPEPTTGVLMGVGSEGGDLIGAMVVPGTEVKGVMQLVLAMRMQEALQQQ